MTNLYWEGYRLWCPPEEIDLYLYRPVHFYHHLFSRGWLTSTEEVSALDSLSSHLTILQRPVAHALLWLEDPTFAEYLEGCLVRRLRELPSLVLEVCADGWIAWIKSEDRPRRKRVRTWQDLLHRDEDYPLHLRMNPAKGFLAKGLINYSGWERLTQYGLSGYRKWHYSEGSSDLRRRRQIDFRLGRLLLNRHRRRHDRAMIRESLHGTT